MGCSTLIPVWCRRVSEPAAFLHLDVAVENGTGGLAPARPLTWQVEYPGQDPEAQKDKLVWEIQVSERDIRALVPLVQVGAPIPFRPFISWEVPAHPAVLPGAGDPEHGAADRDPPHYPGEIGGCGGGGRSVRAHGSRGM